MEIDLKLLPSQYDFTFTEDQFPALVGGLGSGKSEGGINRLLLKMLSNPIANGAYYMPTYDLIKLRAIGGFEEQLTKYNIPYKLNKTDYIIDIENFGDIIFRSYERPERIIAYEVGHSIVDEIDTLPKIKAEYVWRKITERNRQQINEPNTIGVVTTPDNGVSGFVYDKWVKKQQKGYSLIKASTYDNPFLPIDYVETILNNYDPIMADLYLKGEFVALNNNKVYHFFDRRKHHSDRIITDKDTILYIGQDFNIGGTTSSVWVIDSNIPIMVDEIISHDTYDLINNIKHRYDNRRIEIIPDSSGNQESTNATATDIQLLRNAGFIINAPYSNPAIRDRINSVNGLLAHNRMFINTNKCPEHTHALENHAYKDGKPEKFNTHPAIDDFVDDLGYFIFKRFGLIRNSAQQVKMSMI